MRLTYIFIILIIAFTIPVKAQESLSLRGAISKGLENNYGIQITSLSVDIAKNNNSWGTAGLFPQVKLNGNLNNTYTDTDSETEISAGGNTITSDTAFDSNNLRFSPGIALNWVLFNGFAVQITKSKLEQYQELSEGNLAVVVENTIQAIYLGYYSVLLEQDKLNIVSEIMSLSRDRYNNMLERKQLGSASTYDVLQAKNAFLSDSSNYLLQQMNVKNATRNLSLLLGESSENQYSLSDEFLTLINNYEYGDLYNQLQSNNKTLKNQYINQEILKKDIGLAKSSLYPMLSFNGTGSLPYSRTTTTDFKSTSNSFTYSANFSLNFNLFNGFRTRDAIRNAKIQENIGSLQIEEMKLQLSILLANMLDLYNIHKQIYQVSIESLETARLNMELSNDKFKSGAINSFNYRDVQIMYMNASFNQLQARYNLIESHSELMRITGNMITEY